MSKKLLSQLKPRPATMPWANRSERFLLTISEPLHCDNEIRRETMSIHPLKKFPTPTKIGKNAAHVEFSDLIDVREVPPAGNLSLSAGTIWWSREDYSRMLLDTKHVISRMAENRHPISCRSSEVCTLGLETYGGSECQRRRERKNLVTKAVLNAQEKHKLEGIKDPVYIAELSRSFTRASAAEAYLRANDGTEIEIPGVEESIEDQDFVEIRI